MTRIRLAIAALLMLASAAVSGLLLLEHHGEPFAVAAVDQTCGGAQGRSGCETVARSAYSSVRGVPLAALGLAFSLSVAAGLILAALGDESLRSGAAWLGLLAFGLALAIDLALLGVQAVVLKAFCSYCIATYLLNVGALVALLPALRSWRSVAAALGQPDGRLAGAGWIAVTLAIALGVTATDRLLAHRAASRQATLLGPASPAGLPAPAPDTPAPAAPIVEPGDCPAQLQRAQDEARRLQATIDDPKQLDAYFAKKAAEQFAQAPVQSLQIQGVPVKGSANAPIKIVEFSDFLCPFCRNVAGAFSEYVPRAGGRVAVFFKNYPLDQTCNPSLSQTVHPGACWVAAGSVCAEEQGKFWAFHDKAFSKELLNPQPKDVLGIGAEAGVDIATFDACLTAPQTMDRVRAQVAEGVKVGVAATPTLFINGKKLPRINDFTPTIDREALRLGLKPTPAPPAPPAAGQ
jgi:protein-disulfide isomerase/uncharacterized membrane protein